MSGNVHTNPGPGLNCTSTPEEFKVRSGLGIVHFSVRSLLPKIDLLRTWASSKNADITVVSETWLGKSVRDEDISI